MSKKKSEVKKLRKRLKRAQAIAHALESQVWTIEAERKLRKDEKKLRKVLPKVQEFRKNRYLATAGEPDNYVGIRVNDEGQLEAEVVTLTCVDTIVSISPKEAKALRSGLKTYLDLTKDKAPKLEVV